MSRIGARLSRLERAASGAGCRLCRGRGRPGILFQFSTEPEATPVGVLGCPECGLVSEWHHKVITVDEHFDVAGSYGPKVPAQTKEPAACART
jgi:hypothetical protein